MAFYCKDYPCYARFGEFPKKLSAQSVGEKLASAQSMVEINFLRPGNHDTPPPPRGK